MQAFLAASQSTTGDKQLQPEQAQQMLMQMMMAQQQQQGEHQGKNLSTSLLPGINLFNPERVMGGSGGARAASVGPQGQPASKSRGGSFPPSQPLIRSTSHAASTGPTRVSNAPASSSSPPPVPRRASNSNVQPANGTQPHAPAQNAPKLKYWAGGCLKCGTTQSTQWRVRKKRSKPLDGSQLANAGEKDAEEEGEVKKLCEGEFASSSLFEGDAVSRLMMSTLAVGRADPAECAQDLPSMKKKRAEAEADAGGAVSRSTTATHAHLAASDQNSQPTSTMDAETAAARAKVMGIINGSTSTRQQSQTQTSPLRRSPRGHRSYVTNVRQQNGAQPFTSPSRGANHLGKRRFTTALSSAALKEEVLNKGGSAATASSSKGQGASKKARAKKPSLLTTVPASPAGPAVNAEAGKAKKRRITPTNLSKTVSSASVDLYQAETNQIRQDLGDDMDFFLSGSGNTYPSSMTVSGSGLNRGMSAEKQREQARHIFDPTSPSPKKSSQQREEEKQRTKDFLMNASPGTAIRSLLGESGGGGSIGRGTPGGRGLPRFHGLDVQETPGKMLGKYLLDGLSLPAGLSSFDMPMQLEGGRTPSGELPAGFGFPSFSPLGSSLSTPFRNAIMSSSNITSPSKRRASPSRATSEQPPASHEKLFATVHYAPPHPEMATNDSLAPSVGTFQTYVHPSSDDTNLGFNASLHPRINLLPATADRSRSGTTTAAPGRSSAAYYASDFTSDHPSSYPDGILDDFSSFLLKTSSSLMTSPSPPRKTAQRASGSLAPTAQLLRRNSTPTPHTRAVASAPSSELDFEMDKNNTADPESVSHEPVHIRDLPPSSPPPLPPSDSSMMDFEHHQHQHNGSGTFHSAYQDYLDDLMAGSDGFPYGSRGGGDGGGMQGQSPISVGTTATPATQGGTPQDQGDASLYGGSAKKPAGVFGTFSEARGSSAAALARAQEQATAPPSTVTLDDFCFGNDDNDPLLNFFSNGNGNGNGRAQQATGIADKLRASAASGASSALTWSSSAASSSSSSLADMGGATGIMSTNTSSELLQKKQKDIFGMM